MICCTEKSMESENPFKANGPSKDVKTKVYETKDSIFMLYEFLSGIEWRCDQITKQIRRKDLKDGDLKWSIGKALRVLKQFK